VSAPWLIAPPRRADGKFGLDMEKHLDFDLSRVAAT
jgi:hypothetical protein